MSTWGERLFGWLDSGAEVLAALIVAGGALFLALFLLAIGVDATQGYRAYDAQVVCRIKQQESTRRIFSSRVTCIPSLARQDTLSLQQVEKP